MSPTFLDALRLDGKVALVVGAGGDGMGVQTTLALAEAGAAIAGVDWLPENLAALRNRFAGSETRFVPITADVTRPGDVEAAVATAIEAYGQIDLLVNVAGGTRPGHWGSAVDASWAAFDEVLVLNLRYVFIACQTVARHMIERGSGGAIVNFSSVSTVTSAPYHGSYGAAKSAINSLTRTLAVEWAPYGIRVNAVAPGAIRTPKTSAIGIDLGDEPIARSLPPDEVASVILFLLSDLSRGVNGQIVAVDGGLSVRPPTGESSRLASIAIPDEFATSAAATQDEGDG